MDIEVFKKDLVSNQNKFNDLVRKRNELNLEIFRMEGVLVYITEVISTNNLAKKQEKKVKDQKK